VLLGLAIGMVLTVAPPSLSGKSAVRYYACGPGAMITTPAVVATKGPLSMPRPSTVPLRFGTTTTGSNRSVEITRE
jgi:hypothetical protein